MDVDLFEQLYTHDEPVGFHSIYYIFIAKFHVFHAGVVSHFIRRKLRHQYVTHIISK